MRSMNRWGWLGCACILATSAAAQAAPKYKFEQAANLGTLSLQLSNSDLLNGLPAGSILLNPELSTDWPFNENGYAPISNMPGACEPTSSLTADVARNPGISGFHPASGDPAVAKVKLIDGVAGANVDSVLSDFAWPAAVVQFDLPAATDIGEIRVFAANTGLDGRVFQNYDVAISTDANAVTRNRVFTPLIERVITSNIVCDPGDGFGPNTNDGTQVPVIGATATRVFDDGNPVLATGVTSVRFTFWAVSNTQKVFRDQWLGPIGCPLPGGENPATYYDVKDHDGFQRAFESPVIKEIDILAVRTGAIEICDNGIDDDGDTLVDAADPECFGLSCPPEDCTNGVDDTGDGLVDCADPACLADLACSPETCDNGVDDDNDTFIDCADSDCAAFPACQCKDPVYDVTGGGPSLLDPDGAVDMLDFAAFQRCISVGGGSFDALPQVCRCMDKSGPLGVPDQVVDGNDLVVFMDCSTGPWPATAVSPTCDD
jgi:hypothetical protein